MSEELRPCPLCGAMPDKLRTGYMCSTLGCALQENTVSEKEWNTRPIEDTLQSRIANLEGANRGLGANYIYELDENAKLTACIDELEAENEKINYFFRRLRMFCVFAHWDNPNTEAEFYKVDAEIREYFSEYKVCIDQLTAHDAIERQDDKWIPEVQE